MTMPTSRGGGLWAITALFNPAGFRRRAANYRLFRERLGVPLIAVELSFGAPFELTEGDADILIQIRGGDVMWQKERLLNVALQALPDDCRAVAWIDCDIVFERDDWSVAAMAALEQRPLVHLFERLHFMPPELPPQALGAAAGQGYLTSVVAAVERGLDPLAGLSAMTATNDVIYARGTAWAARRELLDRLSFLDVCIIGGGDTAIICSLYECYDFFRQRNVPGEAEMARFREWAARFRAAAPDGAGSIAGDILHLWHGSLADRRRGARHKGLAQFGFDPDRDIAVSESGAWRWVSEKPEMHRYVRDYFAGRREDG